MSRIAVCVGGMTTAERDRIKELERENRQLRQANEILKKGEAFVRHWSEDNGRSTTKSVVGELETRQPTILSAKVFMMKDEGLVRHRSEHSPE